MQITNKITGQDVSREYLGLMSGLITRDEFELLTMTISEEDCSKFPEDEQEIEAICIEYLLS